MLTIRTLMLLGIGAAAYAAATNHLPAIPSFSMLFSSGNRTVDAVIEDQTNKLAQMKSSYKSWKEKQNCFADVADYKSFAQEAGMNYPIPPVCEQKKAENLSTLGGDLKAQSAAAEARTIALSTKTRLEALAAEMKKKTAGVDAKLAMLSASADCN